MNDPGEARRSWRCRAADRLGFTFGAADHLGGEGTRSGLLRTWIARHVERCPRCRAERAEWERILSMLKKTERRAAPPRLLQGVMARIAEERREEDVRPLVRPDFARPDPLEMGAALSLLSVLCGWAGFVAASSPALAILRPVVDRAGSTADLLRAEMQQAAEVIGLIANTLPPGTEPYVTGFLWCAFGLGVAAAVPALLSKATTE